MGSKNSKQGNLFSSYSLTEHECDAILVGSSNEVESLIDPHQEVSNLRRMTASYVEPLPEPTGEINYKEYIYPFENLIFEGGGCKGQAYCGALKELEDIGMLPQIRRFAGASAGAMTAALLSVGYSADDIAGFLSQDLSKVFLDHRCGYFSILPNLLRNFGWNPGKAIFRWFGDRLYENTQDRNITFRQIYERFGKELCIIVTNLNLMTTTYCHVKTCPDMPVAIALRMSMSVPALFAATKYTMCRSSDIFVDGGMLCNFPIHAFDGWWLSLEAQNSYFKKLHPLSQINQLFQHKNRFGTWNDKTLGFLLYSDNEAEMFRDQLESRKGVELPSYPDTKLARDYKARTRKRATVECRSLRLARAVDSLLQVLDENDIDESSSINVEEFRVAFTNGKLTEEDRRALFGKNASAEEAFHMIKTGDVEKIGFEDIVRFLEGIGFHVTSLFCGFNRREITNFKDFLDALQTCLVANVKRAYMEERDVERTVGINTGYVDTSDFKIQKEDRVFLIEQGRQSVIAFLTEYVIKNHPPMVGLNKETTSNQLQEQETNEDMLLRQRVSSTLS